MLNLGSLPAMVECNAIRNPGLDINSSKLFVALDLKRRSLQVSSMTSIPVAQAEPELYEPIDRTAESHEPIQLTGPAANAILVSESDWRDIQETLHLLSIPGVGESIREGLADPLSHALTNPGW